MIKESGKPNTREVKPWWNKPIVGDKSIVEQILNRFHKPTVPQDIIFLYERNLKQMHPLAEVVRSLDKEKFTNQEFLHYVRINLLLKKNAEDYRGLKNCYDLLKVAFLTKDSFIKIEEIEFRYRGSKQQEFYQYVDHLLGESSEEINFNHQNLKRKFLG